MDGGFRSGSLYSEKRFDVGALDWAKESSISMGPCFLRVKLFSIMMRYRWGDPKESS
jgi:hypothetical protein